MATSPAYTGSSLPVTVDITVSVAGATSTTSSSDQFTYEPPASVSGTVSVGNGANPADLAGVCVIANVAGSTGSQVSSPVSYTAGSSTASYNLSLVPGTYNLYFYYCGSSSTSPLQSEYYETGTTGTPLATSATPISISWGTTITSDNVTLPPMPVVSSVSPDFGPLAGGNLVTIYGIGFTGATQVSFGTIGTVTLTTGDVVSDTEIQVDAPANSSPTPSSASVDVTGSSGQSILGLATDIYGYGYGQIAGTVTDSLTGITEIIGIFRGPP